MILRIEFKENAGALEGFLGSLREDWVLTMLHYRNHGGQVGKVLAGVQLPPGQDEALLEMVGGLSLNYVNETSNKLYRDFMR